MHQTPHTTSLIKFERIFASGVIRVTHTRTRSRVPWQRCENVRMFNNAVSHARFQIITAVFRSSNLQGCVSHVDL